jgi:hypothetical protein
MLEFLHYFGNGVPAVTQNQEHTLPVTHTLLTVTEFYFFTNIIRTKRYLLVILPNYGSWKFNNFLYRQVT